MGQRDFVVQTRMGWPDGNCWEACLASLLGCGIEEVPDDRPDHYGTGEERYERLRPWILKRFNQLLVYMSAEYSMERVPAGMLHILSVQTTLEFGGLPHAVIGLNGQVIHNPHPGRSEWGWRGISHVWGCEVLLPVTPLTGCKWID